ncbi:MAG TPA: DUF1516 family protein [Aliicoccus persicus]|uniref:DUF1516 family protein n=1 Tax=Aliicoccus persicus TaxID=930138 RepID=A0A921JDA1_9STAP|nr:DUF1516 family protein [Aliicoccus persicus]
MTTGLLHTHLASTAIVIILYAIVMYLYRSQKGANKTSTTIHMILRVFLVIMLFSGISIYVSAMDYISSLDNGHMEYGIKALLGLLTIGFVEMSLVSAKKQRKIVNIMMIIFIVILVATIVLGSYLDMGTLNFF